MILGGNIEKSPRMSAESSSLIEQLHSENLNAAGVVGYFQQVELVPAAWCNGSVLGTAGSVQYSLGMGENSVVVCQILQRSVCANVLTSPKMWGFLWF